MHFLKTFLQVYCHVYTTGIHNGYTTGTQRVCCVRHMKKLGSSWDDWLLHTYYHLVSINCLLSQHSSQVTQSLIPMSMLQYCSITVFHESNTIVAVLALILFLL